MNFRDSRQSIPKLLGRLLRIEERGITLLLSSLSLSKQHFLEIDTTNESALFNSMASAEFLINSGIYNHYNLELIGFV